MIKVHGTVHRAMGKASSWAPRGNVRRRGKGQELPDPFVRHGPVTGKPVYFTESTTDEALVDTILTKLLRRADEQRSPGCAVTLGYAINEWIRVSELEDSTRRTYERATSIAPSGRYSEELTRSTRAPGELLRRPSPCRKLCDRKPFIESTRRQVITSAWPSSAKAARPRLAHRHNGS